MGDSEELSSGYAGGLRRSSSHSSLTGSTQFSHVMWRSHGMEGLKACFAMTWLPQATTAGLMAFLTQPLEHGSGWFLFLLFLE